MNREKYFDLQRKKSFDKSEYFCEPEIEKPLVNLEQLNNLKFKMSQPDFDLLWGLSTKDKVTSHALSLIQYFQLETDLDNL